MTIKNTLDQIKDYDSFDAFIKKLNISIGNFGGRHFYCDSEKDYLTFNEIVNQFMKLPRESPALLDGSRLKELNLKSLAIIYHLDDSATTLLQSEKTTGFQKRMTKIKQFFGNLFSHRDGDLIERAADDLKIFGFKFLTACQQKRTEDIQRSRNIIDEFIKELKGLPKANDIMNGIIARLRDLIEKTGDEEKKLQYSNLLKVILTETKSILKDEFTNTIKLPSRSSPYPKHEMAENRRDELLRLTNAISNNEPAANDALVGTLGQYLVENDHTSIRMALSHLAEEDKKIEIATLLEALFTASSSDPSRCLTFFNHIKRELPDHYSGVIDEYTRKIAQGLPKDDSLKYEIRATDINN